MNHDANTTAAEHHEKSAKSHRAASSCCSSGDKAGEQKHCSEAVKHSETAHKASVSAQSGTAKM